MGLVLATRGIVPLLVMVAACDAQEKRDTKQRECNALADEIRAAVRESGRTNPNLGVCNDPSLAELAEKCARLATCNDELADL